MPENFLHLASYLVGNPLTLQTGQQTLCRMMIKRTTSQRLYVFVSYVGQPSYSKWLTMSESRHKSDTSETMKKVRLKPTFALLDYVYVVRLLLTTVATKLSTTKNYSERRSQRLGAYRVVIVRPKVAANI